MNLQTLLFVCVSLLLYACVQAPDIKGDEYAFIRSNYPIVSVNGVEVEAAYSADIEAGQNTLVIVYNTYRHDYYCSFRWIAVTGTVYEVTDQENQYPLTLYRWVKTNRLWASRLDPLDPLECVRKPRRINIDDNQSVLFINNINNAAEMQRSEIRANRCHYYREAYSYVHRVAGMELQCLPHGMLYRLQS